jgi:alkylhydroperoxidase family enzyme
MSRIGSLQKPYPAEIGAVIDKITAPGREPLALFTALGQSPRAWDRFMGGSMAGASPLSMRDREIVINRTSARSHNDYEWGIHTKLFARKAELTPEQVRSTFDGDADDGSWDEHDAALIASVDALLDRKKLTDAEFARLKAHFDDAQILEVVQLIAFYHGIALIVGALDLPNEAGMPGFPSKDLPNA